MIVFALRRIGRYIDRITGRAEIPADIRRAVEIAQIDMRARLAPRMAIVGEIVLLAFAAGFRTTQNASLFFVFCLVVTGCYIILVLAALCWRRQNNAESSFERYQSIFCSIQAGLGCAWGALFVTSMPIATEHQYGQLYAIIIGLVSTAVFSGPALYSISFVVPFTLISTVALLYNAENIGIYTIIGIVSYYFLVYSSIYSINKKLTEREINSIQIAGHQENARIILREFENGTGDWIWETDEDFKIVYPSKRFCSVAQRTESNMHVSFGDLVDRSISEEFSHSAADILVSFESHQPFRDKVLPVTVNGTTRWWELAGKPIYGRSGKFRGFRGVGRDVTEVQKAKEEANYLAQHDPLTKLPNRRAFTNFLESLFADGKDHPSALLCVDLDEFKSVNDTFGHGCGDQLLSAVADRMRGCVRSGDQAFRLGGDEFAVVMQAVEQADIAVVAERIVRRLAQPFWIDGYHIAIGACVGIAEIPADGKTATTVHHNADLALYRAKSEGRSTYRFFDAEAERQFSRRVTLQRDVARALERGEMFLEYQPIVDVEDGMIVSAEALLRWKHTERGFISPDEFISAAQQNGSINEIGRHVISWACTAAAKMPPRFRIAINLSPQQLGDPELLPTILGSMTANNLSASRIEFEITEGVILDRTERTLQVLQEIRQRGIDIVLDDFGTGYSSLSTIDHFDFQKIKLDRSFIGASMHPSKRTSILRAIMRLGRALNVPVVAEGIETIEQAVRLRELGCRFAQGFFFYRPMSADELIKTVEWSRAPSESSR